MKFPPKGDEKNQGEGVRSTDASELDQSIIAARYGEEARKKIRDFRVKIDSFYLTAKRLKPSREVSLAVTAFQSARQFCGIMLMEKGGEITYPTHNAPGQPVNPREDKGEELAHIFDLRDTTIPEGSTPEIESLRIFRGNVEDVITDFELYMEGNPYASIKEFISQNKVLESLISGKIWLGEQMAVLYNEEPK